MRIAIVTRRVGSNDGQGRVNREIAVEALRQGHSVHLYCEQIDADVIELGAVPHLMHPPGFLPTRLLRDQIFAVRTGWTLARAGQRYDAVLACGFATWASADVNAVHFMHRSWRDSPFHPWRLGRTARSLYARTFTELNTHLEAGAFRRAGAIVAVSTRIRQELIEAGVAPSRITTILNGVDTEEFKPGPAKRERFGLPDGVKLALFAGDLRTPRKNLDTVLRALVDVPDLHLAVAGDHGGTSWPAMAGALGITGRVQFLGFQTDMPALMRCCDVFVLPSRYEPFGLVLLEALASGLPVVTAANVGGAEIISQTAGVIISNCEDEAALAAALRDLLGSPERHRAMAAAARDVAMAHSWPAMAKQYLNLLQCAAARRATIAAPIADHAHA
jgi:glycosyltransferase involved in cell wall biosynthesis